ncbi:MAG TPA: hypothetical protein VMN79_14720 [Casimicrobiaceae bacterium]|nr:hypothetical protein [Casimicrobiaceae bacterium]
MQALPHNRVIGMLGTATGVAGALLLVAIVLSADPLGRSIGALLGASIAVGLLGTLLRARARRGGEIRRGPRPNPLPQGYPAGPSAIAALPKIDPTVWAFDEESPDFAPIVSLTEARVQRRRQSEPEPCEAAQA